MSRADLRVLVVDDQADRATGLSSLLRTLGCKTSVGFNAAAGGRLCELFRPAIVLVSLQLPEESAGALLTRMRAAQGPSGATIVAYAEPGEPELAQRCENMGFDDFVAAPLQAHDLELLLAAVRTQRQENFDRICAAAARLNSPRAERQLVTMVPVSPTVDGPRSHL
jgi:CheY-like chemotaxis protein